MSACIQCARAACLTLIFLSAAVFGRGAEVIRDSKPISLQRENLTKLRDGRVGRGIKKALESLIHKNRSCAQCAEPFAWARRYSGLYEKSFLVVDAEPNDFGGDFALVVFRNKPILFRVWLYEVEKGEYQIREMTPIVSRLDKRIIDELDDKVYSPYWLEAFQKG